MKNSEIKALTVGPDEVLFISIKGKDVDSIGLKTFREKIFELRPDLANKVFILASEEGIDMAVLKKEDNPTIPRSMKGVF